MPASVADFSILDPRSSILASAADPVGGPKRTFGSGAVSPAGGSASVRGEGITPGVRLRPVFELVATEVDELSNPFDREDTPACVTVWAAGAEIAADDWDGSPLFGEAVTPVIVRPELAAFPVAGFVVVLRKPASRGDLLAVPAGLFADAGGGSGKD